MKLTAGACAILIAGLAGTGVARAETPPALRGVLDVIRARIAQLGPISYATTVHDAADNRTWTNRMVVEASKVELDEQNCRVGYHWRTSIDGKVSADIDTGLPFADATEIRVISMAEDMAQGVLQAGHPTWGVSVSPEVWVVHLTRRDGNRNTVDFRDKATAQAVADAMKQAAKLCQ